MTNEEINLRSEYLYLASCLAAIKLRDSIIESANLEEDEKVKGIVLRELGILFRFWITREIWESLVEDETDAQKFNFRLLHLFNSGFKIPQDGSEIRYAQISGTVDEVKELGRRICNSLKLECIITMFKINIGITPYMEAILKFTKNAVELPIEQIENMLKSIKNTELS